MFQNVRMHTFTQNLHSFHLFLQLFPSHHVNLLHEGTNAKIELTEHQVASLLAMSFFGLHTWERGRNFPRFYITNLFRSTEGVQLEKMRCIFHYFHTLAIEHRNNQNDDSIRTIHIYRHLPGEHEYDIFRNMNLKQNVTPLTEFVYERSGSIEECEGALQVDFANKFIGGGVLGSGCVQEEIRFLINPECLVSLLLCECMKPNEAIAVVGTRQVEFHRVLVIQ